MKEQIFHPPEHSELSIPVFASSVSGGFPSPADDYIEQRLDLNELVVKHPAATFYVRVQGNSMLGAGIFTGDILVVDRAINPESGAIIVAIVDGEFTVKRLIMKEKKVILQAENEDFCSIEIEKDRDFQIWGVVTYVIHKAS